MSGELKIITEPSVYVISRQQVDHAELARFLAAEGVEGWSTDAATAADALPEIGGRLCYMSFAKPRPGGNMTYLEHIKEAGHGSVLEHSVFGLLLTGISRSLTHELVRHRVGISPSQLSQRYVDSSDVAFVVPPALREEVAKGRHYLACKENDLVGALYHSLDKKLDPETEAGFRWLLSVIADLRTYSQTADYLESKFAHLPDRTARRKAARESARSVLPNCTETKIYLTGNGRSWRHFIEQRASKGADAEIRRLAVAVLRALQPEAPGLFGDYEIETLPDGSETASTPYRKI